MDGPTPITILGGFLGAGKTTLVNRILAQAGGRRIGVVVNDFGEINIDERLIAQRADGVVSLTNGCVCCDLGDNLYDALFRLRDRPEPPDALVIETSGVADPARIAAIGKVGRFFRHTMTAVVVDAASVQAHAADRWLGDTILRQIAAADLLIVNKTDLVDTPARAELHHWLTEIAPGVVRMSCRHGDVPINRLLAPAALRLKDGAGALVPLHDERFQSWSFATDRIFDGTRLRRLLTALPADVIRGKGVVRLDEGPDRETIFHRVGFGWELVWGEAWRSDTRSELVLIFLAARCDPATLERDFAAALAASP